FPGMEFLGVVGTAVVLGFGGRRVLAGDLELGTLVAFLLYLRNLFEPVQQLSELYDTVQAATAGAERIGAVLAGRPTAAEPPPAAGSCSTASRSTGCAWPTCAPASATCRRRDSCSPARSPTTSASAAPTPAAPRSWRPPARSAPTRWSSAWPAATTPRSASGACAWPPASGSWSRSRAPGWPTRSCCCWTRRPASSTRP